MEIDKVSEEKMIIEIRQMLRKGETNPSAIAAKLYLRGFDGRFGEIRKSAEYQHKLYSMSVSRKEKSKEPLSTEDLIMLYGDLTQWINSSIGRIILV